MTLPFRWLFWLALLISVPLLASWVEARERPASIPSAEISLTQLPAEAREVLKAIDQGGPFAYRKDGTTFGNREGRLPDKSNGYYREYTVPTPGARDRGARRIIGGAKGERYYTDDHYRSFRRIMR
ncbi:MAG: ribonuclease domain-containing protein [Pseudomonadota bacterium]